MMNLLKNKIGAIFVHIRHQMYQRLVPEQVKKFLLTHPPNLTVQCLFALSIAEIIHFVREEIKFQIWCRQEKERARWIIALSFFLIFLSHQNNARY